jgi:hypothetical protein
MACIKDTNALEQRVLLPPAEHHVEIFHRMLGMDAMSGLAILCSMRADLADQQVSRVRYPSYMGREPQQTYFAPFQMALVHIGSGKLEEAVADLNRAYDQHDPKIALVHLWPVFRPLHALESYQRLASRMQLPLGSWNR